MREKLKSIQVNEYTSPDPQTVNPDTPLSEVLKLMRENSYRHVPVVEGKKAVGIISDRDISLARELPPSGDLKARDVMTENPFRVKPDTSLEDAAFELSSRKFGSAIVEEESGELYGIFTSTDALNALIEVLRGDAPG